MSILLTALTALTLARPARALMDDRDLLDLSLEELLRVEVVYAASGVPQKLSEAPSSVTILSGDDIRALGFRTLADALASVRGIYVSSDRIYQYVGGRGFSRLGDYNGIFLVLVNGHPINDHVYGFAGTSTDGIVDLDDVERIEVARGPISSVYGTAAYLGVVNVITRRPGEGPRLSARLDAGSFGTWQGHATWSGTPLPGVGVVAGGTWRHSDGPDLAFSEFDSPATPGGRVVGQNGDRAALGFLDVSWRDFRLEARGQRRDKDIPTGIYDVTIGAPGTKTRDASGYVDLRFDRRDRRSGRVLLRAAVSGSDYTGVYIYPLPDSSGNYPQDDLGRGAWFTLNGQYSRSMGGHNLLAGGEFVRNFRVRQATWDLFGTYIDEVRTSTSGGVFLQDDFPLAANLRAHAALRLDNYSYFGSIVNPRLALVWSPERRSTVKALYGSGFRAPNAYEIFYHSPGFDAAGTLEPEKVRMLELVVDRELSPVLSAMILGFGYDARDLVASVISPADSAAVFANVDRANSRGVELELRGRWPGGIRGTASYTFQHSDDPRSDTRVANSPEHLARLSLIVPLAGERLRAGLGAGFVSRRRDRFGAWVAGYGTTDLSLTALRLPGGLECGLSVYNLFDRRYADPTDESNPLASIRQDGRTWQVRLRYEF